MLGKHLFRPHLRCLVVNVRVEVLRRFVVLAEELSFTRAAVRLHLSQQVLSAQTRALEAEVGVRLLERTTRQVALTDAGRLFLPHAITAVAAVDAAGRAARGAGRPARVTLGCQIDAQWVLAETLRAFDPAQVQVSTLLAVDLPALHAAAELDAVVGWGPLPAALAEHQVSLGLEEVLAVLREDDPLAAADRVAVSALSHRTLWLWQPGVGTSDWTQLADHVDPTRARITPLDTAGSPAQETMITAVVDQGGCTFAPSSYLRQARPSGVVGIALDPPLRLPVLLAWNGQPDRALRLLLDCLVPSH